MSNGMVRQRERIIETGIEVQFDLTTEEFIHYRYAKGLITMQQAEECLHESLDTYTLRRMERLLSHFLCAL